MATRDSGLAAKLLPTIFEDRALLVVGKPAGVDVGAMPAPDGKPQRGVAEILAELQPDYAGLLPVNRLSRYESGILVFAKDPATAERLRADWRAGRVEQDYVAVVLGQVPKRHLVLGIDEVGVSPAEPRGRAGRPARVKHEPVRGRHRGMSGSSRGTQSHGRRARGTVAHKAADRRRGALREMEIAAKPAPLAGSALQAAQTTVDLIHQGERRAVIRCRTNAPNTHVLRAQLRSSRMRVIGDHLKDQAERKTPVEQTFLHLGRVSLRPAAGEKPLVFRLEPPSDPADYVQRVPDYGRFLGAALVRRLPLFASTDTNCFRLLSGPVEGGIAGLRGLIVEKYGPVVILQGHDRTAADLEFLRDIGGWYRDALGIKTVHAKDLATRDAAGSARPGSARLTVAKRRPRSGASEGPRSGGSGEMSVLGPPANDEIVVTENGLRFSIHPAAGQSLGLFLDSRDNRRRIREISAGKEVLNLFAYTCGFSVAAAAGGARSTASVDISPKHLDWGKRNFELNGIDLTTLAVPDTVPVGPEDHFEEVGARSTTGRRGNQRVGRGNADGAEEGNPGDGSESRQESGPAHLFFRSDAAEFLKRAKRQRRAYDIIIVDAPSFAHARGRAGGSHFSIERDLAGLVREAAEVLRPGGSMFVSTNYRQMSADGLRRRIREGAGHRKIAFGPMLPLPVDFAVDPDHAKAVIVRLE